MPKTIPKIHEKSSAYKPGQKYPTPRDDDSLLLFYTSTYKQKKGKSPMAEKWCIEHGALPHNPARAVALDLLKLKRLRI